MEIVTKRTMKADILKKICENEENRPSKFEENIGIVGKGINWGNLKGRKQICYA